MGNKGIISSRTALPSVRSGPIKLAARIIGTGHRVAPLPQTTDQQRVLHDICFLSGVVSYPTTSRPNLFCSGFSFKQKMKRNECTRSSWLPRRPAFIRPPLEVRVHWRATSPERSRRGSRRTHRSRPSRPSHQQRRRGSSPTPEPWTTSTALLPGQHILYLLIPF